MLLQSKQAQIAFRRFLFMTFRATFNTNAFVKGLILMALLIVNIIYDWFQVISKNNLLPADEIFFFLLQ